MTSNRHPPLLNGWLKRNRLSLF